MNARYAIIALVVLVLVGGGIAFVSGQGGSKPPAVQPSVSPTVAVVAVAPTVTSTVVPTVASTVAPTPSPVPTVTATVAATTAPTITPAPTAAPTATPTAAPTVVPTPTPTVATKFTISGRATDATTGQPLAGAVVYVHLLSACPNPGGSGSPTTVTGMVTAADGTYRTIGIAPGTYLVRANRQGGSASSIRWWNNKLNCQTADQLILNKDATDINFAIPSN